MNPELQKILTKVCELYQAGKVGPPNCPDDRGLFGLIYDLCMGEKDVTKVNQKFYSGHLKLLNPLTELNCRGWVNRGIETRQPPCCRLYLNLLDGKSVEAICKLTVNSISKIVGFHSIKLPESVIDFNSRTDNCLLYFTSVTGRNEAVQILRMKNAKLKTSSPPPITQSIPDPSDAGGTQEIAVIMGR